ncbi:hypothetical protein ASG11_07375 [Sphingomonas sp. Leaf357]|nr:hypothetical protein ASG11_07375 [Sphingomonas sp. Leaf357]
MSRWMRSGLTISLSLWEREGAREAKPSGKGEGDIACLLTLTLTLPSLRSSLPLPKGKGI